MLNWIEATPENIKTFLGIHIDCTFKNAQDYVFLTEGNSIICDEAYSYLSYRKKGIYFWVEAEKSKTALTTEKFYLYMSKVTHFCHRSEFYAILPKVPPQYESISDEMHRIIKSFARGNL